MFAKKGEACASRDVELTGVGFSFGNQAAQGDAAFAPRYDP